MSRLNDASVSRILRSTVFAAVVSTAALTPATASAEALQLSTGIWCDTAAQAESVYRAHLADGLALEVALAMTNAGANDPTACAVGQAIVAEAGEARRFVAGNKMMSVSQYAVFGVMMNGQPVKVKPKVWYTVRVLAKLTAL